MFRLRHCAVAMLLMVAAMAAAQQSPTKPNLTGTWNVDLENSNFGGLEKPQSARYLIRHLGAKVEMQYEQDGKVTRVDVIPDGEERVLEDNPDNENLARVFWSGPVLVFEGRIRPKASSNAPALKWTSRWSVSPDKKELIIERHIASNQATVDQKVVFDKQAAQAKAQ